MLQRVRRVLSLEFQQCAFAVKTNLFTHLSVCGNQMKVLKKIQKDDHQILSHFLWDFCIMTKKHQNNIQMNSHSYTHICLCWVAREDDYHGTDQCVNIEILS